MADHMQIGETVPPARSWHDYIQVRYGEWRTYVRREHWDDAWWPLIERELRSLADAGRHSRHASSARIHLPAGNRRLPVYLKRYVPYDLPTPRKGSVQGIEAPAGAASERGLGQCRCRGSTGDCGRCTIPGTRLESGLLLTLQVSGETLDKRLVRDRCVETQVVRQLARVLGVEVARFHETGFIHGDMVATNIVIGDAPRTGIVFIDHDRTRRMPSLVHSHYARRNLVQLHRLLGDAVTRMDRARFYRAYAGHRGWTSPERRAFLKSLAVRAAARGYPL